MDAQMIDFLVTFQAAKIIMISASILKTSSKPLPELVQPHSRP